MEAFVRVVDAWITLSSCAWANYSSVSKTIAQLEEERLARLGTQVNGLISVILC
jgi:hypothetical protein